MNTADLNLKNEAKNKKKGMTYSIILHLLLLLIAIWPLLDAPADIEKNFAIIVEFEKPKIAKLGGNKASAKSSEGAPADNAAKKEAEAQTEKKQQPRKKITKVVRIDNTTPRPKTKPIEKVLTTPDITTPDYPKPIETPERIETQTNPNEVPTSQNKVPTSIDDFLPELDKIIEEEKNSGSNSGAGGQGDDTNPERGEGSGGKGKGSGKGNKDNGGKAAGSGTGNDDLPPGEAGDGSGGGEYKGEGPLTRRIKLRARCSNLDLRNGNVVLELCINRAGNITYARGSVRKSSIKSRRLVRDFTRCFKDQTIFFPDNSAPYKECGTYTYKVILDN